MVVTSPGDLIGNQRRVEEIANRLRLQFFLQERGFARDRRLSLTGRRNCSSEGQGGGGPLHETQLSGKERLCVKFGSSALHTSEPRQPPKSFLIEPLLGALAPEVRHQ